MSTGFHKGVDGKRFQQLQNDTCSDEVVVHTEKYVGLARPVVQ
jgi:hypothetical protein